MSFLLIYAKYWSPFISFLPFLELNDYICNVFFMVLDY